MITDDQKRNIARLLEIEAQNLPWKKLAVRVGVNMNTIRYNMQKPELWFNVSEQMWVKVAGKLGYKLNESAWNLVPTTNTKVVFELLDRAQNEQLFTAISHNAGHGKSAGIRMYREAKDAVFYIECEESWSHKQFVMKVAELLGIEPKGYSIAALTDAIVHEFRQKAATARPLFIVDEANKLKPSSLRFFIPLYNALQDEIGMVLVGAHDLKKHIQNGVDRDARGFDELESRLGRAYMPLVGIFRQDVVAICQANGLTDANAQEKVWQRMKPEQVSFQGKYVFMAQNDLRVLKQAVKHELKAMRIQANVSTPVQESSFTNQAMATA